MSVTRSPKRASGAVRGAVRAALVLAVTQRGVHCWPSQRAAARELSEALGVSLSTVRLALADETLEGERGLAIRVCRPFGKVSPDPVGQSVSQSFGQCSADNPGSANALVDGIDPESVVEAPIYTSPAPPTPDAGRDPSELAAADQFRRLAQSVRPDKNRPVIEHMFPNRKRGLCHRCGCVLEVDEGLCIVPVSALVDEPSVGRRMLETHPRSITVCVDDVDHAIAVATARWDDRAAYAAELDRFADLFAGPADPVDLFEFLEHQLATSTGADE